MEVARRPEQQETHVCIQQRTEKGLKWLKEMLFSKALVETLISPFPGFNININGPMAQKPRFYFPSLENLIVAGCWADFYIGLKNK